MPGAHTVRAEREGHFAWSSRVDVPSGRALEISLRSENLPVRHRWPTYAAAGTALASGIALISGAVFGVAAGIEPTSPVRADAQRDFEQRQRFGLAADVLLVPGGGWLGLVYVAAAA